MHPPTPSLLELLPPVSAFVFTFPPLIHIDPPLPSNPDMDLASTVPPEIFTSFPIIESAFTVPPDMFILFEVIKEEVQLRLPPVTFNSEQSAEFI